MPSNTVPESGQAPSDGPLRITYQSINRLGGTSGNGRGGTSGRTKIRTKAGANSKPGVAPPPREENNGATCRESASATSKSPKKSTASFALKDQGTTGWSKDKDAPPNNPPLSPSSPSPMNSLSRLSPEAAPFTPLFTDAAGVSGATVSGTGTVAVSPLLPPPKKVGGRPNNDHGQGRTNTRAPVPKPCTGKDQEIKQLSRRYAPAHGFRQRQTEDGSVVVTFDKPIEDPDFPFDLTSLSLRITLPPTYPQREPPTVEVLNGEIPAAVRERIQNRLADQARLLLGGEPFIRALLRVLDQHLERWMVALPTLDTRSSTIKVVPLGAVTSSRASDGSERADLRQAPEHNIRTMGAQTGDHGKLNKMPGTGPPIVPPHLATEDCVAHSLEMLKVGVPVKRELAGTVGRFHPPSHIRLDQPTPGLTARAGAIQIDLLRLSMTGVSLAIPILLGLSLTCGRCRARTSLLDLLPDRDRIISCSGCKQHMEVAWTRELAHERCHRFGFIRCKRCSPADLLPCAIQIVCGQCDPPSIGEGDPLANAVRVEGVQVGERLSFACRQCHRPLGLSYEAIEWTVIPALAVSAANRGMAKGPSLPTRIGEPLPGLGTCAHYRKSHRWFRFPCCGQAYPCDECHRGANPGHPDEWATRQICGYCSREFSTSQKHCECGETPGEATRRTAHWEGGKGTRDQLTMSRKDKRKYRSLTKK